MGRGRNNQRKMRKSIHSSFDPEDSVRHLVARGNAWWLVVRLVQYGRGTFARRLRSWARKMVDTAQELS